MKAVVQPCCTQFISTKNDAGIRGEEGGMGKTPISTGHMAWLVPVAPTGTVGPVLNREPFSTGRYDWY